MGFGASCTDQGEQGVSVVAAVGDDMAASEASQQLRNGPQIMGLAGSEHQPHRQAVLIDDGVDLGTQSATRTADGVIYAPFFPPAACWWARLIKLSIRAIDLGDLADRSRTPEPRRRLRPID
jgi:hypothetical protein